MKVCNKCKKNKPATTEYYHKDKNRKDGFNNTCKECRNIYQRAYQSEDRKKLREVQRVQTKSTRYPEVVITRMDLAKVKYKLGKRYKVTVKERGESRDFTGKLIQETERFITLENKNRIRESFLKVDFYIDAKIKGLK